MTTPRGGGDVAATTTTAGAAPARVRRRQGLPARAHRAARDRDRRARATGAEQYYDARRGRGLRLRRAARRARATRSRRSSRSCRTTSRAANPAYEEMEGVVAGVPELADYDVIIDAGARRERPRERRPVQIKTPAGKDVQAARQLLLPDRDLALRHRAEVRRQGRRARPRRRRQGRLRRGAAGRRLPTSPPRATSSKHAKELDASAREVDADARTLHRARRDDADDVASTSRRGRTRASSPATRPRRTASSPPRACRTSPTSSAASCVIYDSDRAEIAEESTPRRPTQTGATWTSCTRSPRRCATRRRAASSSPPSEADTLGTEAQERAEAIAGQVSQAAGQLGHQAREA